MPPFKRIDKKPRRVTISGAVPIDALPEIESAVRSVGGTQSAFVAAAVLEIARRENRKAAKAAESPATPTAAVA